MKKFTIIASTLVLFGYSMIGIIASTIAHSHGPYLNSHWLFGGSLIVSIAIALIISSTL